MFLRYYFTCFSKKLAIDFKKSGMDSRWHPWPPGSTVSWTEPPLASYWASTVLVWDTMGWGGITSAPGQPDADALRAALDALDACLA